MDMSKFFNHWKTVRTHRKWVRHYCFLAGIPWRGLTHDLSKYSPTEFLESARYWTGTSSPINEAKKDIGMSKAWLHHRGRNRHHWAYWTDNYSEGFTAYLMPPIDFVEMVCDFLGAGRAYNGEHFFTYSGEYKWWLTERDKSCKAMNPLNKEMLDEIFKRLEIAENPLIIHAKRCEVPTPEVMIKNGLILEMYYMVLAKHEGIKEDE